MVKASGQIEQELTSLQQRTEEMSDALELLYEGYLKALSDASKRQLVLAAYHLCTQAYPDKFLSLSWDQRNQLQISLQAIAASIYDQLTDQRDRAKTMSRRPQQQSGLEFLQRLLESRALETKSTTSSKSDSPKADSKERYSPDAATLQKVDEKTARETLDNKPRDNKPEDTSARLYGENDSFDDAFDAETKPDLNAPETPQRRATDSSTAGKESPSLNAADLDELSSLDFEQTRDRPAPDTSESDIPESDTLDPNSLNSDSVDGDSFESLSLDMESSLYDEGKLDASSNDDDFDFEMDVPAADQRLSKDEEEDLLSALEGLARRSLNVESNEEGEEQPLVPIHLVKQQVLLEKAIRDVFAAISEEVNELLQKAEVMPKFPKALMAAAVDARGMGEPMGSAPNVVKVSVRVMQGDAMFEPMDDDDELTDRVRRAGRKPSGGANRRSGRQSGYDSGRNSGRDSGHNSGRNSGESSGYSSGRGPEQDGKRSSHGRSDRGSSRSSQSSAKGEPQIRRVVASEAMSIEALPELAAVSLRLSEVEFSDPTVSAWRGKLRQKLSALKKLGMRYKKTQRALETAQAEDAWRSSWTIRPDTDGDPKANNSPDADEE